jgi:hypothetical protein
VARQAAPDKVAALERRLHELETAFTKAMELTDRVTQLEDRLRNLMPQIARTLAVSEVAGPGMERPGAAAVGRSPGGTRRSTAVEAYAEGLRNELRARAQTSLQRARSDSERCDKAAALAAEAELLGAPGDGTAERLRDASGLAGARESALQRIADEIDLYEPADLPVAQQLLSRLEDGPAPPDPAPSLEPVAQAVVRAAKGGDCRPRTAWLKRGAVLCGWLLVEPPRGSAVEPEWHQAVDSGGSMVVRLACPGLKRADGSGLVRARVQVDPAVASQPEEPEEPKAVPEPLEPPPPSPPGIPLTDESSDDEQEVPEQAAAPEPPVAPAIAESAPPARDAPVPLPAPRPRDPAERTDSFASPFGDGAEVASAANASGGSPRIVSDDPARSDVALAQEVALAVDTEVSSISGEWAAVARGPEAFDAPRGPDEVVGGGWELEDVHELTEPLPEEEPKKG